MIIGAGQHKDFDFAEFGGVAFGLEGDGSAGEEVIATALFEEGAGVGIAGVELGLGVFEDDGAVDFVPNQFSATDFDFEEDPLVALDGW